MDLMKLFKDEAIIELLELGELTIDRSVDVEDYIQIYFTPTNQSELTKVTMELILDFAGGYNLQMVIGGPEDKTFFIVSDYE